MCIGFSPLYNIVAFIVRLHVLPSLWCLAAKTWTILIKYEDLVYVASQSGGLLNYMFGWRESLGMLRSQGIKGLTSFDFLFT